MQDLAKRRPKDGKKCDVSALALWLTGEVLFLGISTADLYV